jgi:hypothetical protein
MCVRCGTGRIAWCTDSYRHGESTEPVSPGDPPVVTETARTFYLLVCRECGDGDLVMPFGSPAERGKWAGAHTRGTGHDRWFVTESDHRLTSQQVTGMMARNDEVLRGDPRTEGLRLLAADLLELYEAGAVAGIRTIVSERLRQVRGDPAQGIDGRAFQAAMLAEEIDQEAVR